MDISLGQIFNIFIALVLKHDMDRLIEMMTRLEDKIDRINK